MRVYRWSLTHDSVGGRNRTQRGLRAHTARGEIDQRPGSMQSRWHGARSFHTEPPSAAGVVPAQDAVLVTMLTALFLEKATER